MITLRATVPGPWGKVGSEIHRKEVVGNIAHHVKTGALVEVDTYAGMTAKERAQARAKALGLSTKGTEKQIEERIEEYEAEQVTGTAPDSTPGDGTVVPAGT